jgi:hypothetical protein
MINKKSRRVLQSNKEIIIKKSKTSRKTNKITNKKVNRKANKKTKVVVKHSHKIKKTSKKANTKYYKTNRHSSKKSRRKSQKVTRNTKKNNKSNSKKTTRNTKKNDKRKSKKKRKTTNTKKSKLKQRGGYNMNEIKEMVQGGTLFDIIDEKDPKIFKDGEYSLTPKEVVSIIPMDAIGKDDPRTIEGIKKDLNSESEIEILERKFENLYKYLDDGDNFNEIVRYEINVKSEDLIKDNIFLNENESGTSIGVNLVERIIYLLKLIKFYNKSKIDKDDLLPFIIEEDKRRLIRKNKEDERIKEEKKMKNESDKDWTNRITMIRSNKENEMIKEEEQMKNESDKDWKNRITMIRSREEQDRILDKYIHFYSYVKALNKLNDNVDNLIEELINEVYITHLIQIKPLFVKKYIDFNNEKEKIIKKYYEDKSFSKFLKNVVIKYKDDKGEILIFTLYNYLTNYKYYYLQYKLKPLIKGEILINGIEFIDYKDNRDSKSKIEYRPKTVLDLEKDKFNILDILKNTYFVYEDIEFKEHITNVYTYVYGDKTKKLPKIGDDSSIISTLNSRIVPKSVYSIYINEQSTEAAIARATREEAQEEAQAAAKKKKKKKRAAAIIEQEAVIEQEIPTIKEFFGTIYKSKYKNFECIYNKLKKWNIDKLGIPQFKKEVTNYPLLKYIYIIKNVRQNDDEIIQHNITKKLTNEKTTVMQLLNSMHFYFLSRKGQLICFTLLDYYTATNKKNKLQFSQKYNIFRSAELIKYSKAKIDNSVKEFIGFLVFCEQYMYNDTELDENTINKNIEMIIPDKTNKDKKVKKVKSIFNKIRDKIEDNFFSGITYKDLHNIMEKSTQSQEEESMKFGFNNNYHNNNNNNNCNNNNYNV